MLTLRCEHGLTQAGLAALRGVSRRAFCEWEDVTTIPKMNVSDITPSNV